MNAKPFISKEEIEVLSSIVSSWDSMDCPLPGNISFQKVCDVLNKLGISIPPQLRSVMDGSFEKLMNQKLNIHNYKMDKNGNPQCSHCCKSTNINYLDVPNLICWHCGCEIEKNT